MSRRNELLDGKLSVPTQIEKMVNNEAFNRMFNALWHTYLIKADATTSTVYWNEQFNDNKAFNLAMFHLSKAGWIVSTAIPGRNWATLQLDSSKLLKWVSEDELTVIRRNYKFSKYRMTNTKSTIAKMTATTRGLKDVGIVREGIAKSGNSEFNYDQKYLAKYYDVIIKNTTKSMAKVIAKHDLDIDGITDYASVSKEIIDFHLNCDETFTMGDSYSDSRGRAISKAMSKVFNPIGFKDARALVVGPKTTLGIKGYGYVFRFIAELLGDKKSRTIKSKIKLGRNAYNNRTLLDLDYSLEEDRANAHENIWLERLYDNLDNYDGSNWTVSIERDYTASVLGITGVLLNHRPYTDGTNITGRYLEDIWTNEGIPRKWFKEVSTPTLYGSKAGVAKLWAGKKYTLDQAKAMEAALKTGKLAVANEFKDYIIDNVRPKPKMKVTVWNDTFTVYCNKYHDLGEYMEKFPIYDTASDLVLTINHVHTKQIADLERFKIYFQTLLIHGIDSQIADAIVNELNWSIPIYDAFLVMPIECETLDTTSNEQLNKLYLERKTVLKNYFKSIGIKDTNGSVKQWKKMKEKCVKIKKFKAQATALK